MGLSAGDRATAQSLIAMEFREAVARAASFPEPKPFYMRQATELACSYSRNKETLMPLLRDGSNILDSNRVDAAARAFAERALTQGEAILLGMLAELDADADRDGWSFSISSHSPSRLGRHAYELAVVGRAAVSGKEVRIAQCMEVIHHSVTGFQAVFKYAIGSDGTKPGGWRIPAFAYRRLLEVAGELDDLREEAIHPVVA